MIIKRKMLPMLKNTEVADGWYSMDISIREMNQPETNKPQANKPEAQNPEAGQFISIGFPDKVFRRPFAISGYIPETSFSILYQIRQHYTPINTSLIKKSNHNTQNAKPQNASTQMSQMQAGDMLDIMYFHGNHFPLPSSSQHPILVGGGIGLGPLLFFSEVLLSKGIIPTLIIGARSSSLIPEILLKYNKSNIIITTDDGSLGKKGNAIERLQEILPNRKPGKNTGQKPNRKPDKNPDKQQTSVYFCGPHAMMKAGAVLCTKRNISAWASLESIMACSMGACMSCVVPISDIHTGIHMGSHTAIAEHQKTDFKWKRICTEGTVFDIKNIVWEAYDA